VHTFVNSAAGVGAKGKPKCLSFQEFNSKMDDAWTDCEDDDILKGGAQQEQNERQGQGRVRTISGGEVRAGITMNPEKSVKNTFQVNEIKKEESKVSRPSPLSILSE
jgi:hypothetical protein